MRQQLAAALAAIKVKDEALDAVTKCIGAGKLRIVAAEALAIQPDDSALTDFLGEPVAWIDESGFLFHTVNEQDEYTPLYSPKGMTR